MSRQDDRDHESYSFEAFAERFAAEFDLLGSLTADTSLYEELELDSFDLFRLLIWLEALGGVDVPPDDIPPMFTLGDAHRYVCLLRGLQD